MADALIAPESQDARDLSKPSILRIFLRFLFIGVTAYGGPAMMPLLRDHVVSREKWVSHETFKLGLSLCQIIPGGTLMQLTAFIGFTLRGLPGAIAGFIGFGLPSALLITGLAALYYRFQGFTVTVSAMAGLSVVVLGILLLAVVDFQQRYARDARSVCIALAAAGLFLGGVGPGWIILGAALVGLMLFRGVTFPKARLTCPPIPIAWILALCLAALGWLGYAFFFDRLLFDVSLSMAKVDMLAFGGFGAFPVMYHEVIEVHRWMPPETFLDGMSLSQVTPGPILLAACFVGYHLRGVVGAMTGGIWIFTTSFFILLAAMRFCDVLLSSVLFRRALLGVLATLGGLILAVGVTLARGVDWTWPKALLGALALLALWRKVNPLWVVIAGALVGVVFLRA